MTGAFRPGSDGTTAKEGSPVSDSMSSGDFTVLSRYSRNSARPTPPTRPTRTASKMLRAFCGREGLAGASAGSTTRMLLERRPAVMLASFSFCSSPS